MADKKYMLAPVELTKQQKQHLKKKALKTGDTMTTIVRGLIQKDMEAGK